MNNLNFSEDRIETTIKTELKETFLSNPNEILTVAIDFQENVKLYCDDNVTQNHLIGNEEVNNTSIHRLVLITLEYF